MNKKLIAFFSLLLIWSGSFIAKADDELILPLGGNKASVQSYSELQYAPPAEDNGELVVDFQNDESESF